MQDPCICDQITTCQRSQEILVSYAEKKMQRAGIRIKHKPVLFKVSELDRENFEQHLLQFKESLLTEDEKVQTPVQQDIITGFSYDLIQFLCTNMEHITDVPYLLENFPFFDSKHAKHVYSILM